MEPLHRRRLASLATVALTAFAGCSDAAAPDSAASAAAPSTAAPTTTSVPAAEVPTSPSSGCAAEPAVAPGVTKVDVPAGTESGFYNRHVPPAASTRSPLPLVVELHGYSSPADVQGAISQFARLGETEGFITLQPQIVRPVPRWGFGLDDPDLDFVAAVVDHAEAALCVDRNRVFLSGFSNGALMVSSLVCRFADRIAAVAPVAGLRAPDGCAPSRPVPVISFHGTADTFVSYDGGFGSSVATLAAPDGKGTIGESGSIEPGAAAGTGGERTVAELAAVWATRNGCESTPAETSAAADVTRLDFACPAGADVELDRVEGGGHAWPGSEFTRAIENVVGPTTFSVDATAEIWAFFEAHPLRGGAA